LRNRHRASSLRARTRRGESARLRERVTEVTDGEEKREEGIDRRHLSKGTPRNAARPRRRRDELTQEVTPCAAKEVRAERPAWERGGARFGEEGGKRERERVAFEKKTGASRRRNGAGSLRGSRGLVSNDRGQRERARRRATVNAGRRRFSPHRGPSERFERFDAPPALSLSTSPCLHAKKQKTRRPPSLPRTSSSRR
jgi:hypothetical protein